MPESRAPITVALVDDDWHTRVAVPQVAVTFPDRIRFVAEVERVDALLDLDPPPDVVLLDVYLGEDDELSIEHVPALVARGSKVLLHTKERAPAKLIKAVELGAHGLVLKYQGPQPLLEALLAVAADEPVVNSPLANALLNDSRCARLTPRQLEVLELIADGQSEEQVAAALFITRESVKKHMKDITAEYRRLGRPSGGKRNVGEATKDGHLRPRGATSGVVEESP